MSQQTPSDALQLIGTKLPPGEYQRDAIHVAVVPATAAERLFPGQHVGFVDGLASTSAAKKVGVVDVFLGLPVLTGERFYVMVYPRTITSLKHVWEHPDFPENGG